MCEHRAIHWNPKDELFFCNSCGEPFSPEAVAQQWAVHNVIFAELKDAIRQQAKRLEENSK